MDSQLTKAFNEGDDLAFVEIYKRLYTPLINHARLKTGDIQLAEDMVQDVFANLYLNKNIRSNVEGYLYVSLKRKILNYWRHEKVKTKMAGEFSEDVAEKDSFLKLERKEFTERLYDRVQDMSPQCQKVFLLKRADYSNKEIASELNISVKTVEAHFTKALQYLRGNLQYPFLLFLFLSACLS